MSTGLFEGPCAEDGGYTLIKVDECRTSPGTHGSKRQIGGSNQVFLMPKLMYVSDSA